MIGFLGLGSMGTAMAGRLIETGHDVLAWNRSAGPAESLAGAAVASSAAEALAQPVSFSMLANDEAADAVLSVENIGDTPGRIHVNTASISMNLAGVLQQRFEAAGVRYVAAPVLGRPPVAAAGKLNILAAGAPDDLDAVLEYLEALGVRVWRLGEKPPMANAVKIAVNYNIIHALEAIGESVALVERQGIDPAEFTELLSSTLFTGVVYQGYGAIIAQQNYVPPGFTVTLGLKDLALAEEIADDGGVTLPTAPALRAVFERTLAEPDLAEADWAAIAEVARRDLH
ncbi:3-hydroxyisobutyrate dehydrogenase-like beta-hydroxyacid dehydrogenase [Leifsonia sp. AK011]|uniref:NAD(P)-dependent oxidoreductase n=1 Tax=Leifsonia sp. AK011 TaxID=2723075 RepID=UPI001837C43C|nr:NAD(P)-dependent oxidoreductase [Leifsonia sp. AK011]NYF09859.1 3-hydroxyisobutyrate dehydrogenase-like beta-hydroxyacid dehydrogenase [Leifsonia sp. AK011]